ncbi:MAG: CNP1-like family protein, partial [Betaproteobacteria bacterium]|nr:CNP1-like family protein [Betaproteobacteria bacterium]
ANRTPAPSEAQVELPAYPAVARLIEFEKHPGAAFRYFIDPETLSVDKEGVVRYVLVARSSSGVQNVSYEGLRCETAEYRFYAFGQADGTWSRSRSDWRSLQQSQPLQRILYADYFCPQKVAIFNPGEGVRALRDGGHPFAKGFGGELGRDK